MAAKCFSCKIVIMNNEFISCAGVCGEIFHMKCVAMSRATLNAIKNCPNIHWYCNDCNDGNRHISAGIKSIDDSIARLSTSLSCDLLKFLDGLNGLMDNVFGQSITTDTVKKSHLAVPRNQETNVGTPVNGSMEDVLERVITMDNVTSSHLAIPPNQGKNVGTPVCRKKVPDPKFVAAAGRSAKSIVISNIGTDVSMDCLKSYLSTKLGIEETKIHMSLLLPIGKDIHDMHFLQYKATIPDDYYSSIMSYDLWPPNVRLRDFVKKGTKGTGVTKDNFLVKSS